MRKLKQRKVKAVKTRDMNIAMNSTMEVNYNTRSIPSKKNYNRKKLERIVY